MQDSNKHLLTLENRKALSLTGVTEIESSDENLVKLKTNLGKLSVFGTELSIGKINVDTGEFSLNGHVKKLEYKTSSENSKLSSLFK